MLILLDPKHIWRIAFLHYKLINFLKILIKKFAKLNYLKREHTVMCKKIWTKKASELRTFPSSNGNILMLTNYKNEFLDGKISINGKYSIVSGN